MFLREKYWRDGLPVYDVKELTMEEALLVFAAEKESMLREAEEREVTESPSFHPASKNPARVA
jgi:hypothetical protein